MTATIDLRVRTQGGWHTFVARFATADQALAYIERKSSEASFVLLAQEEERENLTEGEWIVYERLNPTCEHGLSEDLCHGPDHYPSREWEIANGW